MGERVDLDWAENCLSGRASNGLGRPLGIDVTLALVAELRVAREVVEAARWMHDEHKLRVGPDGYHDCVLCSALERYDQHTQDPGP